MDDQPDHRRADAPARSSSSGIVIVVGVDGSPTSLHAGAYAAGLARRLHARLVVVHVQSTPAWTMLAPEQSWPVHETLAAVADDVRRQVEVGAAYTGIDMEFLAVDGDPYSELCRAATAVHADAVVVGASMHTGHRLMGSVAVRLVRAGRWPVTVVP